MQCIKELASQVRITMDFQAGQLMATLNSDGLINPAPIQMMNKVLGGELIWGKSILLQVGSVQPVKVMYGTPYMTKVVENHIV